MPDFPSAFAATCEVPSASAVTSPVPETLTIFGSCTVQVTVAPGTGAPPPSSTWACSGSWALRTSVEVAGVTTIVATCGVASGPVLPHDQLESATMITVVSVRTILGMSALRRGSVARTQIRRVLAAHKRSEPQDTRVPPLFPSCQGGFGRGQFTVIEMDPLFPPVADVFAVIVTVPLAFPVTTPFADTVAVAVLELDQRKL